MTVLRVWPQRKREEASRMRTGVQPSLAGICPTAHEGILGGAGEAQPPAKKSLALSGEERDPGRNPSGSRWVRGAFCSGQGGGFGDPPRGWQDPNPPQAAPWDGATRSMSPRRAIRTSGEMAMWGMLGWSRQ